MDHPTKLKNTKHVGKILPKDLIDCETHFKTSSAVIRNIDSHANFRQLLIIILAKFWVYFSRSCLIRHRFCIHAIGTWCLILCQLQSRMLTSGWCSLQLIYSYSLTFFSILGNWQFRYLIGDSGSLTNIWPCLVGGWKNFDERETMLWLLIRGIK